MSLVSPDAAAQKCTRECASGVRLRNLIAGQLLNCHRKLSSGSCVWAYGEQGEGRSRGWRAGQDNTLRMWDMRPFAPANRCTKVFTGHQHNFEQNLLKCDWSSDGSRVRSTLQPARAVKCPLVCIAGKCKACTPLCKLGRRFRVPCLKVPSGVAEQPPA